VPSYSDKWEAERIAKRVAGVTALANDIEVKLSSGRTDPDIAEAARSSLKSDSRVPVTFAVLFALLALSNISKPLSGGRAGFVFLGTKTAGVTNAILGPAFGIFLLIYALGIWRQKRWAVPMAWAYAAYVLVNLALFIIKAPEGSQASPVDGS
jgi:hypothetical protein